MTGPDGTQSGQTRLQCGSAGCTAVSRLTFAVAVASAMAAATPLFAAKEIEPPLEIGLAVRDVTPTEPIWLACLR